MNPSKSAGDTPAVDDTSPDPTEEGEAMRAAIRERVQEILLSEGYSRNDPLFESLTAAIDAAAPAAVGH